MKNLENRDLQLLLSTIEDLNSDVDANTLPERAISAAAKIIDADSVAFTGFSYNGSFDGFNWHNSEEVVPESIEIFAQYVHEQPLIEAYLVERRTETLRITDIMPAKDFQRTALYNEFYKRVGVTNQLVAPMPISDDFLITCSINTIREDFSDRDKLILTLIAPHLANAIRNSFAYQRLSSALETEACGIIAINSQGKPLFISEYAEGLLEKYFVGEKRETNSLPEGLASWIKQIESLAKSSDFKLPLTPLKIENQKGVLTVRFMHNSTTGEKTLLLEERKLLSSKAFEKFNLTRRETEILFWIMQGKTDDIIARICNVSPRTVNKHIQNIYVKLGVETRISAMLIALENQ